MLKTAELNDLHLIFTYKAHKCCANKRFSLCEMVVEENTIHQDQLYYRLITLWVISEGMIGGIIHGFHIPFSGMFLSGFAVLCICLIGYYKGGEQRTLKSTAGLKLFANGYIIKATIIVCVFKMMLSPNTPPTAYFAVLFQGLMGQILFLNLRYFRLSCIVLGFLALVESSIQRILVLVVLYGTDFWSAVNVFITKLTHEEVITNYTFLLAIVYISIHGIFGIFVGIWAYKLIRKSKSWRIHHPEYIITELDAENQVVVAPAARKKKRLVKKVFIIIWIILALLFFQSLFGIGKPILPSSKALQILVRSILILFTWLFLVSPFVTGFIKKKLQNPKEKSKSEIQRILKLLPSTKNIFAKSWSLSESRSGLRRLSLFWKIVLTNILREG